MNVVGYCSVTKELIFLGTSRYCTEVLQTSAVMRNAPFMPVNYWKTDFS